MRKLEEWIDLIEGESSFNQNSRLGLLLKHSIADQLVFDNLRRLRRIIKASDPSDLIEPLVNSPKFMENMHRNIMAQILEVDSERNQVGPSARPQDRPVSQAIYKT